MAAVVKSVSFQPEVLNFGLEEAKELFGDNFSIFITFLICSYRKNKPEYKVRFDKELGEEVMNCLEGILETFK